MASYWNKNLDTDGLSFSQDIDLADGFVGSQQSQSGFYIQQPATPCVEEKAKVKENDEVPSTEQKKKRQKNVAYLNKKPGEKRQNKYYWPKIDMQKKPTPRPKTPKPVTSKPRRKHTKNKKDNPGGESQVLEQALEKILKANASSKRALSFEDRRVANIGLDVKMDSFGRHSSLQRTRDIEKEALDFESKSSSTSNLSNPVQIPHNQETVTQKHLKVYYRRSKCLTLNVSNPVQILHNQETVTQKHLKVYYRRCRSKCLNNCRNMELNFPKDCKRRRLLRDQKSIMGFKRFEGFNRFSIDLGLLNRIAKVRGKKRMILPSEEENTEELFPCIMRLLSSRIRLRTRRRSFKRAPHSFSNSTVENSLAELRLVREQRNPPNQISSSDLSHVSVCGSNIEGIKTKATIRKRRGLGKRKMKRSDYLSTISDWKDSSLEHTLDPLVQHFESMELYDDPKTLERWSVLNNYSENTSTNGEETNEQNPEWEEDRRILLRRIAKFIYVMTWIQGRRDFIRWKGSVLDSVVGVFLTQNVSDVLSSNAYIELGSRYPLQSTNEKDELNENSERESSPISSFEISSTCNTANVLIEHPDGEEVDGDEDLRSKDFDVALNGMFAYLAESKGKAKDVDERNKIDWETIRVKYAKDDKIHSRNPDTRDSIDWDAVRMAPVHDIATAIYERGQHQIIAAKIKKFLNRLLDKHGTLNLEWLRETPHQVAKAYLLSFYGLGLKSVECLRLLTLHHHGFPVDVNIARVAIRLGWVPLKPLPMGLPFHRLEKYPLENEIQKYLWGKLQHLDQETLYKLHCHMITFGKVFCAKKNPNCGACPFKGECKYYASLISSNLGLPKARERRIIKCKKIDKKILRNPFDLKRHFPDYLSLSTSTLNSCSEVSMYHQCNNVLPRSQNSREPIVEVPSSPEYEPIKPGITDIEDLCIVSKDDTVSELELDLREDFKQNTCDYYDFEKKNLGITTASNGNGENSKALISLSPYDASKSLPKHMFAARLRTEHQVYELPDFHPLLENVDRRDEKDLLPYLLAVWTPEQIKKGAEFSEQFNNHCFCIENAQEEPLTIAATLLIPSRTAVRGFFPLNGTYFQVNEVFADDESSQRPIDVPRKWLWNLPRRTLYCGSGITSIFRGLTWREIQRCCCEGFICTRGFNRKTRAPKKLHSRLHAKTKSQEDQD